MEIAPGVNADRLSSITMPGFIFACQEDSFSRLESIDREVVLREARFFSPRAHVQTLEEQFPQAFSVLQRLGAHPCQPIPLENAFLSFLSGRVSAQLRERSADLLEPQCFDNVGAHCVAVALFAERLLKALDIPAEMSGEVVRAALLHDADKPMEVMRRNFVTSIHRLGDADVGFQREILGQLERRSQGLWQRIRDPLSAIAYASISDFAELFSLTTKDLGDIAHNGRLCGPDGPSELVTVRTDGSLQFSFASFPRLLVRIGDDCTFSPLPAPRGQMALAGERFPAYAAYLVPKFRAVASEFSRRYAWMREDRFIACPDGSLQRMPGAQQFLAHRPGYQAGSLAQSLAAAGLRYVFHMLRARGLLQDKTDCPDEEQWHVIDFVNAALIGKNGVPSL